ncbi:ACP S-malonyltransferase [Candidatus Babeliales bacterium]|nr:ACP S-malonyltransferase [Candidatus Babeliales bacterium]MBP9843866.1 ACP S-malonyltransferase [Candidatus Babeliales bacterium]
MKKTIGVMFSGYGQQFVTMGKDLYDESRHVQDLFEQASMCLDINFVQLCFASSDAEISELDKGYLAILLFQVSFYSQLSQAGLKPDFIAGFGIGEFAAAVASGSLSFADGLYLLSKYAKILKEFFTLYPDYSVLYLSKGFTQESLEELCEKFSVGHQRVFIAAHTTEQGFYVAGPIELIEQIKEYCKENEIRKVKQFTFAYGLHSSILDAVPTMLSPYLFKIDFKPLKFPIITGVDGAYVTSADALESAMLRQVNNPIVWDEVMDGFVGCEILICVGPGNQLQQWAQLKYPDKEIYSVEKMADVDVIKALLEKYDDGQINVDDAEEAIIHFGVCHLDTEIVQVPDDLTVADEMNELPSDYDIDEEDELES